MAGNLQALTGLDAVRKNHLPATNYREFFENLTKPCSLEMAKYFPRIAPCTCLAAFAITALASLPDHPNIIFVQVDSMDGRTALPSSPALTPNIDRLAARGVRFDNAYCAAPECVPSRAALWSGRRTDQTGAWANGHGLPPDYPIIMRQVEVVGYDTMFIGRHDFLSGSHSLSANLSTWVRAVPNFAIPSEDRPKSTVRGNSTRVHGGDWVNSDKCVKWLADRIEEKNPKPFMLSCGFSCPHPGYSTSHYWLEKGVNMSAIRMPVWQDEKDMHPVQLYEVITKNCSGNWSADEVRAIRATYYAMVAEADAFSGQIFDQIANSSLVNNTVVFFWSDHGDMTMSHKQFYKETTLEGGARVPLIVAGPDGIRKGAVQTRPTSLIDLFPTIMDLAHAPHPDGLAGFSLLPDLLEEPSEYSGPSPPHPDWVLSQAHMDHSNTGQFMLRQNNWKYIEYAGYPAQLFDLDSDPDELHDLSTNATCADTLANMSKLLRTILDPEDVDKRAKTFDKESFRKWKDGLGDDYNKTIGSPHIRWYWAWNKNPELYLSLIDKWLNTPDDNNQ